MVMCSMSQCSASHISHTVFHCGNAYPASILEIKTDAEFCENPIINPTSVFDRPKSMRRLLNKRGLNTRSQGSKLIFIEQVLYSVVHTGIAAANVYNKIATLDPTQQRRMVS